MLWLAVMKELSERRVALPMEKRCWHSTTLGTVLARASALSVATAPPAEGMVTAIT